MTPGNGRNWKWSAAGLTKCCSRMPASTTYALRYRYMQRCVVLGRGYNYCTAFEWSLKMKEMSYTVAEPYSSADFLHGPIAMMETGFPVMAVLPSGAVFSTLYDTLHKIRTEQNVRVGHHLGFRKSAGFGAITNYLYQPEYRNGFHRSLVSSLRSSFAFTSPTIKD